MVLLARDMVAQKRLPTRCCSTFFCSGYELSTFIQNTKAHRVLLHVQRTLMNEMVTEWLTDCVIKMVRVQSGSGGPFFPTAKKLLPTIKGICERSIHHVKLFGISFEWLSPAGQSLYNPASITAIIRRLHRMCPFLRRWKIECGKGTSGICIVSSK